MSTRCIFLLTILLLTPPFAVPAPAQDMPSPKTSPFADFESGWGDWTTTGDAFGSAPATDALFPGKIRGFDGRGFLSTLHPRKGNLATGKAVSREFLVEKPSIAFRIGGGNFPGQACLNLVVDGKVERSATGSGTPTLSETSWDVSSLVGKKAHLEILDNTVSANRGYLLVDDIRFTDPPEPAREVDWRAVNAAVADNSLGIDLAKDLVPPGNIPGESAYLPLPHVRQERDLCVPTSAAMVLQYYGEPMTPREIKVLSRGRDYDRNQKFDDFSTTWYADLLKGLSRRGYVWQDVAYPNTKEGYARSLGEIFRSLDRKRPVLIDTTLYGGHTMAVCGYSKAKRLLIVMDPNIPAPGMRALAFDVLPVIWKDGWTNPRIHPAVFTQPRR
ncbi:MAG: C39 family peptidase [Cytophagales bacterium]|nr:C39 family peptidase [Armatimonadota bacterium]